MPFAPVPCPFLCHIFFSFRSTFPRKKSPMEGGLRSPRSPYGRRKWHANRAMLCPTRNANDALAIGLADSPCSCGHITNPYGFCERAPGFLLLPNAKQVLRFANRGSRSEVGVDGSPRVPSEGPYRNFYCPVHGVPSLEYLGRPWVETQARS